MSSKSSKGPKKIDLTPKAPREMAAINEDYGRLVAQAGQNQYQSFVLKQDLERINGEIQRVNYEAHARQQLDSAAKQADAAQPGEVNNEQS